MNAELWVRVWFWGHLLACVGVAQFVCLTCLAMLLYPGGTLADPGTTGYSLANNFLSDLGRTVACSDIANSSSSVLFNTSLVILGLSLIPFFLLLPFQVPDRVWILALAGVLGVLSTLALMRIGLTPYDRYNTAHYQSLILWTLFLLGTVGLHALALFRTRGQEPWALVSVALVVLILVFLGNITNFALQSAGPEHAVALRRAALWQKAIVGASILWFAVFGVRMILQRAPRSSSSLREQIDRDANQYLERLQRRQGP